MDLKLKICGLRNPANVELAEKIQPDFLGFIFYPGSPRYVGKDAGWINGVKVRETTEKVGVFVDTDVSQVLNLCNTAGIQWVQLHGQETVEQCRILKENGFTVMKVFPVGPGFQFNEIEPYCDNVDYFLFDTKSEIPGGSGVPFEWDLIGEYPFEVPFFLSGGIGPDNILNIKHLEQDYLFGIDVNSRLESVPGEKDSHKLKEFKRKFDEIRS